jgi:hypothetical protein
VSEQHDASSFSLEQLVKQERGINQRCICCLHYGIFFIRLLFNAEVADEIFLRKIGGLLSYCKALYQEYRTINFAFSLV